MSTNYKADFPLLAQRDIAYLDSAATAQRPPEKAMRRQRSLSASSSR